MHCTVDNAVENLGYLENKKKQQKNSKSCAKLTVKTMLLTVLLTFIKVRSLFNNIYHWVFM